MPKPICQKDGQTKNDCEQNAMKRWLQKFRQDHRQLKVTITADNLSSKGPTIQTLQKPKCHFILVAKPSDHKYLFDQIQNACEDGPINELRITEEDDTQHDFRWLRDVMVNESHPDVLVNVLEYWCSEGHRVQTFSWVID
ncbi:MAG: hypothetical protein ACFCD0_19855 [Gemmataceae bacterium]